jgi:hypothetical protein
MSRPEPTPRRQPDDGDADAVEQADALGLAVERGDAAALRRLADAGSADARAELAQLEG